MEKSKKNPLLDIEFYIDAAVEHGVNSEPDHEVGDLQDFLRSAWSVMTPEQHKTFALRSEVASTLEATYIDEEIYAKDLKRLRRK